MHRLRTVQGAPPLDAHHDGAVLPQTSPNHRKRARRRQARSAALGVPPGVTHSNPLATLDPGMPRGSDAVSPDDPSGLLAKKGGSGIAVSDRSSGAGTPIKSVMAHETADGGAHSQAPDGVGHGVWDEPIASGVPHPLPS